ncbi:MAG: lipopolysaccharide biosynthesis protein, partial [Sphingomonadales bacterium]
LVGGTVVAHAITLLTMPISTRLFTPHDFSALSVFSGLVGILAIVACLRFDAAILMPENDADAVNLLAIAIAAAVATSLLVALVLALLPQSVLDLLKAPELLPYMWLLPVGVFITGLYLALQAWFVRKREFGRIARSRAGQAAAASGVQIGMGYAGIAPLGLILGYLINYAGGVVMLLWGLLRGDRALLGQVRWPHMRAMFKEYDRFPRYSVWEGLANGFSNSAPIILIAAMATGPEAGYLALSLFALQAPMALLGNAIAQVYLSEAPKAHREGRLGAYTSEVLVGLAVSGSGPMLFAAIAAPTLFGLIFGEAWTRSGVLVAWMAPWFFLQFISAPICNALHVLGRQRLMMNFHILGMVLRIGAVLLAGFVARDWISEARAVSGWFFYGFYLAAIVIVTQVPLSTLKTAARRSLVPVVLAIVAGIA